MAYVTSGSLRGNSLEIGIALVLQDRFSNQAKDASAAIRRLHNEAKEAVTANLQTADSILDNVYNGFLNVATGITNTVLQGAEFIDTMTTVSAITGSTREQLQMLSETAQSLGLETMFGSQDIASGMKYLAMAGNTVEQVNDMIKGAAYVANATGMELGGKGGAADLITNVMKTFKIVGDGASELVGDQLTKATLSANISMTDLAESIKYSAADMVMLKKELPEVAAMIGTLGNAGIQGSMAGTSLGNMARYLIKAFNPKTDAYSFLQRMGLSQQDFVDAQGDLIDFGDIMEKISKGVENLPSIDRGKAIGAIFGVRGQRAANAIMNDLEGYRNLLDQIQNNSAGFAKSIVDKRMNTLAGSIDKVSSAWENLKVAFTEQIGPALMPILNTISQIIEAVREFVTTPVGAFASQVFVLSTFIGLVGTKVLQLITKWRLLRSDTQIGFTNMFRLIRGGWQGATLDLQNYMRLQGLLNAQTTYGLPYYASMAKHLGTPVGGVVYDQRTKRWRSHDQSVTGLGKGTFMKERDAIRYTETYGTGKQVVAGFFGNNPNTETRGTGKQVVAGFFGNNPNTETRGTGKQVVAGFFGNNPNTETRGTGKQVVAGFFGNNPNTKSTWWTKILGIGSKLFSGLSLVSLGLTLIMPLIKMAANALDKNTKQIEKNTFSVNTLAGKFLTEEERKKAGKNLDLPQEVKALNTTLGALQNYLKNNNAVPVINITVDQSGNILKKEITKSNQSDIQTLGAKN
jgi:TP901 family phage tail tape measure protein